MGCSDAAPDSPGVKSKLEALGADVLATPANLAKTIAREARENANLVKQAGSKVQ